MFAGDVDSMTSLLRSVKRNFPKTETPSVEEVSKAVTNAYHEELVKVKEERHLKPNKLDWDRFQKNSPPLFTDRVYEQMKSQLDETRLSLDPNQAPLLLVAGFDNSGPGHIFSVDHPGTSFGHDLIGFHAIGTGYYYALTMLHSHSRNTTSHFDPLNIVLYRVAEAKFMAENDPQVGKSTTLIKWEINDKPYFILEKKLRKIWNRGGRPKVPQGIGDKIKTILDTDSYFLGLPEQLPGARLEQGLSDTPTETPQGLKDIIEKNSRAMLEFVTNTSPD
jgi:hypothetical protein